MLTITITDETQKRPGVAEAAAKLVSAMGGVAPVNRIAKVAKAKPVKPALALKAKKAPPRPSRALKAHTSFLTPLPRKVADNWEGFVAAAAPSQQKFLRAIQTMGRMSVPEIAKLLEAPNNKSVGGVIGSMMRWAAAQGFKPPMRTVTVAGVKHYLWNQ